MCNYTLNRERNHFCSYCLQNLSIEQILKGHIKYSFKINNKQRIIKTNTLKTLKLNKY